MLLPAALCAEHRAYKRRDRYDCTNRVLLRRIPFGGGPRMCLGYILALTEIKILLAVLARTSAFRVLNPDEPYIPFPLPVPRDGLPMDFEALPRSA